MHKFSLPTLKPRRAQSTSSGLRVAAGVFAAARIAFGAGLIAAPSRVGGAWIGEAAAQDSTAVAVRGLGFRDAVLAGGLLVAARRNTAMRPWLSACVAGDLADIAATLAARESLPRRGVSGTVVLAGVAAAIGTGLAIAAES